MLMTLYLMILALAVLKYFVCHLFELKRKSRLKIQDENTEDQKDEKKTENAGLNTQNLKMRKKENQDRKMEDQRLEADYIM